MKINMDAFKVVSKKTVPLGYPMRVNHARIIMAKDIQIGDCHS